MHITLHSFSEKCLTKAEMALRRKLLYQEVKKEQNEAGLYHHDDKAVKVGRKPRRIYKPKCKILFLNFLLKKKKRIFSIR